MSVRRTTERLQGLWALTMEFPPHTPGRASPPARDVEGAFGYDGYADPTAARRAEASDGFHDDGAHARRGASVDALQPPRLQGEGPLSRVAIFLCLTLLLGAGCLAWSFFLQLAVVDTARGALADVVDSPARRDERRAAVYAAAALATAPPLTMGRSMRRMPALLRRFAKLERAAPPASGADPGSLRLFFPTWFAADDADGGGAPLAAAPALADVALALSLLVAHEVAEETDAPPPAPPPSDAGAEL